MKLIKQKIIKEANLYQVKENIYLLGFKNHYKMGMHFCKLQECYESPSTKFRGKSFSLFDFMEHHCDLYKEDFFSYGIRWAGFNLPSNTFDIAYPKIGESSSRKNIENKYDEAMLQIKSLIGKKDFYLIGSMDGNTSTIDHEVAHGLFYTNKEYKSEMTGLVKMLEPERFKKFSENLLSKGYCKAVIIDEIQAYAATDGGSKFLTKKQNKLFKTVFDKHNT